jgi:hypothetical protein
MKVLKYSQFKIQESQEDVQYFKMLKQVDERLYEMQSLGAPEREISEGIMDILGKLGGGATDRLKNYAAGWLLDKIGLPPENAFFSEWAKNIIEQVSFTNIGKYFGAGSCKYWIDAVVKGLMETIEEKSLNFILGKMGYEVNFTAGIGGSILGSVREALTNALNDTNFVSNLATKLDGTICGGGTSFSTVFGGGKFSEKDLKNAAVKAGAPMDKKMSGSEDGANLLGAITGAGMGGKKFDANSFWSFLGI